MILMGGGKSPLLEFLCLTNLNFNAESEEKVGMI